VRDAVDLVEGVGEVGYARRRHWTTLRELCGVNAGSRLYLLQWLEWVSDFYTPFNFCKRSER
jgi:hypothetical protein